MDNQKLICQRTSHSQCSTSIICDQIIIRSRESSFAQTLYFARHINIHQARWGHKQERKLSRTNSLITQSGNEHWANKSLNHCQWRNTDWRHNNSRIDSRDLSWNCFYFYQSAVCRLHIWHDALLYVTFQEMVRTILGCQRQLVSQQASLFEIRLY